MYFVNLELVTEDDILRQVERDKDLVTGHNDNIHNMEQISDLSTSLI